MTRLVLDRLSAPVEQHRIWSRSVYTYPDDVAIKRVVGRRTDPETGRLYHLNSNPPPNDKTILDRLVVRSDDTIETMKQRLKHFYEAERL